MQRVLIDCDPGVDDAVALLYAMAHLDVVAVTIVAGNVPVDRATANALAVIEAVKGAVPVARGCDRPWVDAPRHATEVHGETGLAGAGLPPPKGEAVPAHAVDCIIDCVLQRAQERPGLGIVALGPLTNLATALRLRPEMVHLIPAVVVMGGSTTHGNITPVAEFNVHFDPEAAHAVFHSGLPITMVGLNVTERVAVRPAHIDRLRRSGKATAQWVADLLEAHARRSMQLFGLAHPPLHDACAVAALIRPELLSFRECTVEVELASPLTRGMTVCDLRAELPRQNGTRPKVRVAVDVDADLLTDHIIDSILTYP